MRTWAGWCICERPGLGSGLPSCCRAPPCSLPSPSWPSSATSSLTSWDGDPDCEGSRVRVEMDPGCSSLTRDCGRVTKLPSVAGLSALLLPSKDECSALEPPSVLFCPTLTRALVAAEAGTCCEFECTKPSL